MEPCQRLRACGGVRRKVARMHLKDEAAEQEIQNKVVRICVGMVIGGIMAWRAVTCFCDQDPLLACCPTAVATLTYRLALRGLIEGAFAAGGLGLVWEALRTKGGLQFKSYVTGLFRLAVAVSLVSAFERLVALGFGMFWNVGLEPVSALAGWRSVQIVTLAMTALLIPWTAKLLETMAVVVAQKALGVRILSFVLPALALGVMQLLLCGLLAVVTRENREEEEGSGLPPAEYRLTEDELGEVRG